MQVVKDENPQTVLKAWIGYHSTIFPPARRPPDFETTEQFLQTKQAFYAGALAVFNAVTSDVVAGKGVPEMVGVRFMNHLAAEMKEFREGLHRAAKR